MVSPCDRADYLPRRTSCQQTFELLRRLAIASAGGVAVVGSLGRSAQACVFARRGDITARGIGTDKKHPAPQAAP